MQAVVLALVIPVLRTLFAAVTPALRDAMTQYLRLLYGKALATVSPWDDFAVGVLCGLAGVSIDGVSPEAPVPGTTPITMPKTLAVAITQASFPVAPATSGGGITTGTETIPGMQGA